MLMSADEEQRKTDGAEGAASRLRVLVRWSEVRVAAAAAGVVQVVAGRLSRDCRRRFRSNSRHNFHRSQSPPQPPKSSSAVAGRRCRHCHRCRSRSRHGRSRHRHRSRRRDRDELADAPRLRCPSGAAHMCRSGAVCHPPFLRLSSAARAPRSGSSLGRRSGAARAPLARAARAPARRRSDAELPYTRRRRRQRRPRAEHFFDGSGETTTAVIAISTLRRQRR